MLPQTWKLSGLNLYAVCYPSCPPLQGLIAAVCSDIEKSLGVATPPLIHEHPNSSLYDAAQRLIQTHARRLPLLDNDSETGHQVIVSVLTQYRLLKFIAINVMYISVSCRDPLHLVTVLPGYSVPPSSSPQTWHRHIRAT